MHTTSTRTVLATGVLCLLALSLSGCESIVNSVQGAPTREIYPGQTVIGSLNINTHSRIKVKSHMRLAPPGKVFVKTGQDYLLDNTYSREESFSGTTELWKINTEYLTEPTAVALIVQGAGFEPSATLFVDASEGDVLSGRKEGYSLPEHDGARNTVAGVYVLKPKTPYFMTVQASGEPVDASYQVVLQPLQQ